MITLYTPILELRVNTSHAARFRRDYLIIAGYQSYVSHITLRSGYFVAWQNQADWPPTADFPESKLDHIRICCLTQSLALSEYYFRRPKADILLLRAHVWLLLTPATWTRSIRTLQELKMRSYESSGIRMGDSLRIIMRR